MWPGNYSAYAVARELELVRRRQQYVTQQKEIARLEEAIRRFKDWAHRVVDERHIKRARNAQLPDRPHGQGRAAGVRAPPDGARAARRRARGRPGDRAARGRLRPGPHRRLADDHAWRARRDRGPQWRRKDRARAAPHGRPRADGGRALGRPRHRRRLPHADRRGAARRQDADRPRPRRAAGRRGRGGRDAREVPLRLRAAAAPGRGDERWRAHPPALPVAHALAGQLPRARRADEPPRHPGGRDARGRPRTLRRDRCRGQPRPLLPRPHRRPDRRGPRRRRARLRGRLQRLGAGAADALSAPAPLAQGARWCADHTADASHRVSLDLPGLVRRARPAAPGPCRPDPIELVARRPDLVPRGRRARRRARLRRGREHRRLARGRRDHLGYPLGDLALLAFVVGVIAVTGWRPGRTWVLIAFGFGLFAVIDTIYLYQVARDTYVEDRILDAGWPAMYVLVAFAAWQPQKRLDARILRGGAMLALPAGSAVVALGLLLFDHYVELNDVALWLASASVLAVVVRFALTFRANLRMLRASEDEATTDALTGLGNRRALVRDLEHAAAEAEAGDEHVLALFDLDGFKSYNDAFGHPAGDALLERLGASLAAAMDGAGSAYRMGGDEFCILAPVRATRPTRSSLAPPMPSPSAASASA